MSRRQSSQLQIFGSPIVRGKRDSPEIRRRAVKLDRNLKSISHFPAGTTHFAGHAFLRAGVLQHQSRLERQALLQNDQRTVVIHAQGSGVEGSELAVQSYVDAGTHSQQHPLAAPPVISNDRLARSRPACPNGTQLPAMGRTLCGRKRCFRC